MAMALSRRPERRVSVPAQLSSIGMPTADPSQSLEMAPVWRLERRPSMLVMPAELASSGANAADVSVSLETHNRRLGRRGSTPAALPSLGGHVAEISLDRPPPCLRRLDYWQVLDYWNLFDKSGAGVLGKDKLFSMLVAQDGNMRRAQCDQLFDLLDKKGSGELQQEEFLDWCFGLHDNSYSGGVRHRLGEVGPSGVEAYFQRATGSAEGVLDKGGFFGFINNVSPKACMSKKETDTLFSVIDRHRSGAIDAKDFIAWLNPTTDSTATRSSMVARQASRRHTFQLSPLSPKSHASSPTALARTSSWTSLASAEPPSPSSPVSPSKLSRSPSGMLGALSPKQPASPSSPTGRTSLNLEFTVGQDFEFIMAKIKASLKKNFGSSVHVKVHIDTCASGCTRCFVHTGRGVLLWDQAIMVAFRDNPFESHESAQKFVHDSVTPLVRAVKH